MNKSLKKILFFILLSAIVIVVALSIPNFRRDYFSPIKIEHLQCTAYCRWLNTALFNYSDDYYKSNKTSLKIDIIDSKTINLLKEKKYADINQFKASGAKTTYPAQPGNKCQYIMSKDDTVYCKYHGIDSNNLSEEYKNDLEFSKIIEKLECNYAFPIILVLGIIIWKI